MNFPLSFGSVRSVGSGSAQRGVQESLRRLVNVIGAVRIAALVEGFALAEEAGLDLDVVLETISPDRRRGTQVARNAWTNGRE